MTAPDDEDTLREQAQQRIEDLPAETALGHRDPQGGGQGEPADVESGQAGRD